MDNEQLAVPVEKKEWQAPHLTVLDVGQGTQGGYAAPYTPDPGGYS